MHLHSCLLYKQYCSIDASKSFLGINFQEAGRKARGKTLEVNAELYSAFNVKLGTRIYLFAFLPGFQSMATGFLEKSLLIDFSFGW